MCRRAALTAQRERSRHRLPPSKRLVTLSEHQGRMDSMQLCADRLATRMMREENRHRLLTDGCIVAFDGWVSASSGYECDAKDVYRAPDGTAVSALWTEGDPEPDPVPSPTPPPFVEEEE